MEHTTKFIGFSNQKGGVGKTAITMVMASYCHNTLGLKVGILDCDFPQHSIYKQRQREIELIKTDNDYKAAFIGLGRKAYAVEKSTPAAGAEDMNKFLDLPAADQPYDLVFVDLPGTINSPGVLKTISELDHIFIPMIADEVVTSSTLEFAMLLQDNVITKPQLNLKQMHLFWNAVDKREHTSVYAETNAIIRAAGLQVLNTQVENSLKFRKPEFRSTFFPLNPKYTKDSKIIPLVEEILKIVTK
jgi:cellulose biosynthesis protein BcsQ